MNLQRFILVMGMIGVLILGILTTVWLLRPSQLPPVEQLHTAAGITQWLLSIAVGAGVAAMATVQFWKVMFLPRAAYHATELGRLFGDSLGQVLGLAPPIPGLPLTAEPPPFLLPEETDLPSIERQARDLLDNPTEVVMGQLRSSAEYILLRPQGFEGTLFRLAGRAGRKAVETYLQARAQSVGGISDPSGTVNDALVQVRFFVEQRLNLIHVRLKQRWRRLVRTFAVVVAACVGVLAVALSALGPTLKVSAILVAGVWGGFFSWLARDLVALIERHRN